ncbi:MAG TPA: hypothetical protein VK501_06435 [Baekduia sp.]|uniref:ArnT family glycosyltransferase n=1 Tax=Baekduia sp. TaxID=2600305 RepID=UPI002BB8C34D|nr:hypothetical protein [Baekduia sp.]HMJ33535.1 hypothetical protein [Baekduia sp.]
MAHATEPSSAVPEAVAAGTGDRRFGAWLGRPSAVATLYAVAVGLYLVLGRQVEVPFIFPDEARYSQLARSLVHGHGFVWRGTGHSQHVDQTAALYVYFIAPAWWLFHSAVQAREASTILGTLALCSQVVPVWLLARTLVGPRRALAPAALSVAGTWMLTSAFTLTEALALPLSTAALCCTVAALRRPGSRLWRGALGFTLLAIWARPQLIVLIPVMPLAIALDALRSSGHRRQRLAAHRRFLVASGSVTLMLLLAVFALPSAAGDYGPLFGHSVPPRELVLSKTGLQLTELVILSGFLPALLTGTFALSRPAWRHDDIGPLLTMSCLVTGALALQSGAYLAAAPSVGNGIERYVDYVLPLMFTLMVVAVSRQRISRAAALTVGGMLAVVLLQMPEHQLVVIEAATWSTTEAVRTVTHLGPSVALASAVAVAVVGLWAAARTPTTAASWASTVVITFAVLVVQDVLSWRHVITTSARIRSYLPEDKAWLDRANGPVAFLAGSRSARGLSLLDYYSPHIAQQFWLTGIPAQGQQLLGNACEYHVQAGGTISFGVACGATPHRLLLLDTVDRWRFYGEHTVAQDTLGGRVVETEPTSSPRLVSRLELPCDRPAPPDFAIVDGIVRRSTSAARRCTPALQMAFWLDQPGRVRLFFHGTARKQHATIGALRYGLRPNRVTLVEGDVPAGDSQLTLHLDWARSDGPNLVKAQLRTGGRTISLIY